MFRLARQKANTAFNAAEHAYVMENGRIVKDGPANELRGNRDIQ